MLLCPKASFLLFGFVYFCAGGIGDCLIAVSEIRHALCDIAGDNQHSDNCQHWLTQPVGQFTQLAALPWNEAAVLRAADDALKAEDQRRHEQQDGQQAERNALSQYKAHVRADAEAHERERKETDDCSRA